MPPAHAHFIQDISLSRPSLRDFVLDRASEPLTSAYEHCVAKLVALRNYHINMVSRFITVPASRAKVPYLLNVSSLHLTDGLSFFFFAPNVCGFWLNSAGLY